MDPDCGAAVRRGPVKAATMCFNASLVVFNAYVIVTNFANRPFRDSTEHLNMSKVACAWVELFMLCGCHFMLLLQAMASYNNSAAEVENGVGGTALYLRNAASVSILKPMASLNTENLVTGTFTFIRQMKSIRAIEFTLKFVVMIPAAVAGMLIKVQSLSGLASTPLSAWTVSDAIIFLGFVNQLSAVHDLDYHARRGLFIAHFGGCNAVVDEPEDIKARESVMAQIGRCLLCKYNGNFLLAVLHMSTVSMPAIHRVVHGSFDLDRSPKVNPT